LNRGYKCLVELCFRETEHTFSTKRKFQRGQEKLISEEGTRIALFCSPVQEMRLHLARGAAGHATRFANVNVEEILIRIRESPAINKVLRTVSQWIRIGNSKLFFLRKIANFIDQS